MIEVVVGTNVNTAVAGLEKLETKLNNLPAALKPLQGGITILNTQLERLQRIASLPGLSFKQIERLQGLISSTQGQIKRFEATAGGLGPAFQRLGAGANSANLSLLNTGRVIQDLPFGFLGIANNLNPLLESFQRLKTETGSTKTALSALGQSFLGAGGLGFALSIVSSALIVFGDRLFGNKKKTEESKAALDALTESLGRQSEMVKNLISDFEFLSQISKINLKINFDTGVEQLGLEGDIIGLANARAKLQEQIAGLEATENKLREQRNEGVLKEKDYIDALGKVQSQREKFWDEEKGLDERIRLTRQQLRLQIKTDREKAIEDAKQLNEKEKAAFEKFQNEIIQRARQFSSEFGNAFVVPDLSDSFLKSKDQIFQASKKLLDDVSILNLKVKVPLDIDFDLVPAQIGPPLQRVGKDLEEAMRSISGIELEPFVFDPSIIIAIQTEKAAEDIKKQMADLQKSLDSSIKAFIASTAVAGLSTIGEAIGTAIAGGNVKAVFEEFAATIAEGLQALGKEFIKFGVLGLLAQKAIKSFGLNPGLAIAAGIALIAAGAALKSALGGGIKARAKGGPVNPGEPYLVGERGPEIIVPRFAGTVIPNHSASGIAGAMGNKAAMQPIVMGVEWSGDVFRLIQKRSEKRAGRSYG